MRTVMVFVAAAILFSCHATPNHNIGEPALIEGYWIPDSIKWLSANSGYPEIDSTMRPANFRTLCFDKEKCFYVFQATQNFPKTYDSLIFESEPGVSLYKGEWNFIDQDKIAVEYEYKRGSVKKGAFKNTVTLGTDGGVKTILFDGTTFKKTRLYDGQSKRKLGAYKDDWLP